MPENELSRQAGVKLGVTGGPEVDETMGTNIEGIFACGNVLHVHDLVDFVTEESYNAGKNAADYIKGKTVQGKVINLSAREGVGYTVPKVVHLDNTEEGILVRFRVRNVYKDSYISVYFDNERVVHKKKRVLAPGEMETLKLTQDMFKNNSNCENITIKIEQ